MTSLKVSFIISTFYIRQHLHYIEGAKVTLDLFDSN